MLGMLRAKKATLPASPAQASVLQPVKATSPASPAQAQALPPTVSQG